MAKVFRFSEQEENIKYVLVVQGRPIVGLRLSAGGKMRPLLRPMVKYVGNMHGNELAGRQVLIALAEYLVHNYGVDDRVTRLLNTTEVMSLTSIILVMLHHSSSPPTPQIHLVPTMNPDGYAWTSPDGAWSPIRRNAHDVDLNR